MPVQPRRALWTGIALAFSLAVVAAAFTTYKVRRGGSLRASKAIDERATLPEICSALREGDGRALVTLLKRTEPNPDGSRPRAVTEAEAKGWVEVLQSMRTGFLQFSSYGRAAALTVAGRILDRFAITPTPGDWVDTLPPTHDLFTAGLADQNLDVRLTSLNELGKRWSWLPGRTALESEELKLAEWKDGFREPVTRRLADPQEKSRIAAIVCLGLLPIETTAAAAIPYLNDTSSADVRKQVMISFAARPSLLSEDAILKHIHDNEAGIPEVARIVLKTRGLTDEQISLGSMIFHPKPEMRASVFGLLKGRTDIDPVVWLLQLSHDDDETVRVGSVDALAERLNPEVGQRLAEMAGTDQSPAVRRAAGKHLPEIMKTASLPPLPGSPSLNPKAN